MLSSVDKVKAIQSLASDNSSSKEVDLQSEKDKIMQSILGKIKAAPSQIAETINDSNTSSLNNTQPFVLIES